MQMELLVRCMQTPRRTQFYGEKQDVSVPPGRATGRYLARPRVLTYPRRQQAVITAAGRLAGGIFLIYSGDMRPVLEINSNDHGREGDAGDVERRPRRRRYQTGKGHTNKRKRPRFIMERPQHGDVGMRSPVQIWIAAPLKPLVPQGPPRTRTTTKSPFRA